MSAFAPTDEQELAVDLFSTGLPLVINAGAGTGKTATLELIAQSTGRRGRYLAFNRAIVEEAKARMPGNVTASTLHSLAFHRTGKAMAHRLDAQRLPGWRTAQHLSIDPLKVTVGDVSKLLQPGWLAGHVMRAATRFCQSADPEPGVQHFSYVEGIDLPAEAGIRTYGNNRQLADALLPALKEAWRDLCDPAGVLRYSHDVYLKVFALEGCEVSGDFVLHDEAQDANPVTLQILAAQDGKQIVHVGDEYQAIHGWRGAVNAMADARSQGAQAAWLSQSFRFGPPIADLANQVLGLLGDVELQLAGTDGVDSRIGRVETPDAVLCRTNAEAVNQVMLYRKLGRAPFLVGGGREIVEFARAAIQLQNGETTAHPELACFDSWTEVNAFVAQDAQGDELRMMVNLIDEYEAATVIDALTGLPGEHHADVVVSTAHKAKGLQWPTVRLGPDFDNDDSDRPITDEEIRLLYMAVTRAQHVIDISACRNQLRAVGVHVSEEAGQ